MENNVYKVLFRGVILPGFEKDQVMDNVHAITRIPKETINRKFFSGKTVVIRHADTLKYAEQLKSIFAQAGIETYIEEAPANSVKSEIEKSDKLLNKGQNWKHNTLVYSMIIVITGVVAVIYFISTEQSGLPPIQTSPTSEQPIAHQQDIDKQATTPDSHEIRLQEPDSFNPAQIDDKLLSHSELQALAKITAVEGISPMMLKQLLGLFRLPENYYSALQSLVKQEAFSNTHPLYLYRTNREAGMILIKNDLTQKMLTEYSQQENKQSNPGCQGHSLNNFIEDELMELSTASQALFISSANQAGSKRASKHNHLHSLWNKTSLSDASNSQNTISLFYKLGSDKPGLDKQSRDELNRQSIIVNLFSDNQASIVTQPSTSSAIPKILKQMNPELAFKTDTVDLFTRFNFKITDLDGKNLIFLIPLFINQSDEDTVSKIESKEMIPPANPAEHPAPLKKDFNVNQLIDYKPELDLELVPQWSKGPFAIATKSYWYDQHLFIELLAKGQNIFNLMEHAHLAQFQVFSVENENGINIQVQPCLDSIAAASFFKDFNGKQEAYINDDFISFYSTETNHMVQIQPGHEINNIKSVQGDIELRLPVDMRQLKIDKLTRGQYLDLDSFTVVLNHNDKNSLDISVIGKTDDFLTVRAYNQQGEFLPAENYDSRVIFDNLFEQRHYLFKETIASIVIFSAKTFDSIHYPFKFKPVIQAKTSLTENIDIEPPVYKGQKRSSIFPPLATAVTEDYPTWLGEKLQSIEKAGFNISLFSQAADEKDQMDAVLSVKSALTPFLQQNLSALRLTLKDNNHNILFDNYLSFIKKSTENKDKTTTYEYLNANLALSLPASFFVDGNMLIGQLDLNLPTVIKEKTITLPEPGELIAFNPLSIRLLKITNQQLILDIDGPIDQLVQIKLYNKNNLLISTPLEFKRITADQAELVLSYADKIKNLQLVYAEEQEVKHYPFSMSQQSH